MNKYTYTQYQDIDYFSSLGKEETRFLHNFLAACYGCYIKAFGKVGLKDEERYRIQKERNRFRSDLLSIVGTTSIDEAPDRDSDKLDRFSAYVCPHCFKKECKCKTPKYVTIRGEGIQVPFKEDYMIDLLILKEELKRQGVNFSSYGGVKRIPKVGEHIMIAINGHRYDKTRAEIIGTRGSQFLLKVKAIRTQNKDQPEYINIYVDKDDVINPLSIVKE